MKRQLFSFIIIISMFFPHASIATSQDLSSLVPESTPTTDPNTDIDKIRQVVKDKVKQKIDSVINGTNQKFGWFGKVVSIDQREVTITDISGQDRKIIVDDSVVILNTKKQSVNLEDLKPDQTILSMGYIDTHNTLLAKRILITNTPMDNITNTIICGTVSDISQTTPIITLVTKDRQVYQIKSDKNSSDLQKNQKILAVIRPEKKDSKTWLIIFKNTLSPPN